MVSLTDLHPPADGVRLQADATSVQFGERNLGTGTLYITEANVSWVNDVEGRGFTLEYRHIALHAVSTDLNAYPQECLYLMVERPLELDSDHEDGEPEDSDNVTSVRFIPADKTLLHGMYQAMCDCQKLHPDPDDVDSDDPHEFGDEDDADEGHYELGSGDTEYSANMNGDDHSGDQYDDADSGL